MSSPTAINRAGSPSTHSESDTSSSLASSVLSTSSASSSRSLIYSRDELLALATSPLSFEGVAAELASFPEIKRKIRRGAMEAFQALEYSRGHVLAPSSDSTPLVQSRGRSPRRNREPTRTKSNSLLAAPTVLAPAEVPPTVWKVDVYVPPARRVNIDEQQQQRARPGREIRGSRFWRKPGQARPIQVNTQGRW